MNTNYFDEELYNEDYATDIDDELREAADQVSEEAISFFTQLDRIAEQNDLDPKQLLFYMMENI